MHEHAVMVDLVREIERVAESEHATRVTGISVELGALSHFTPEHFLEHFQDASTGTIAAGARVDAHEATDPRNPRAQGVVLLSMEIEAPRDP
jgi:hydrogenase nickel incorporation protein HypA/HybF